MAFLLGVICGIALTLGIIYASIALYRFEPPEPRTKRDQQTKEHGIPRAFIDLENNRDAWLNYLINFVYREFCHSDVLHNFALRKINAELEEIRMGPAARFLSRLELNEYEFGSHCPILKNFRLAEPEGFDSDVLPDALSIEFDVDYDVQVDAEGSPFHMSADAVPVIFGSMITVTVKILKFKGRVRLHLSRSPVPYWYASFVAKPELDIRIETNLNNRYATTLENLFTTHMQRMVQRRHTIPKFKVRHSPLFSNDHFNLRPVRDCDQGGFIDFNHSSAISITAWRGRGFPCAHAKENPSSNCFVTFMLSSMDWDELVSGPNSAFAATQTMERDEVPLLDDTDPMEYDQRYDEFVNISIAKTRNVLVTEDETESDMDDIANRTDTIPVQVGRESRRAKMMAAYGKVKEMAKERVKERIEPVLKHRKRADTSSSSTSQPVSGTPEGPKSDPESKSYETLPGTPTPSSGFRRKMTRPDTTDVKVDGLESESIWDIVSAQKQFYRTRVAPRINGIYQWRYETFNAPIKREYNFILIGVWEKPHARDEQILVGQLAIPLEIIYSKASQTLGKTFVRKVRLQRPRDFSDDQVKDCVGDIASNRGFRREMAFGELTLKIALSSEEEKERERENLAVQTDAVDSTTTVVGPGVTVTSNGNDVSMGSRGRNLIGNIKQKFWTDKTTRKTDQQVATAPVFLTTPEPTHSPKMLSDRSRSNSHLSLKSNSNLNLDQLSENEEFFVPLINETNTDLATTDDGSNIEVGTLPDERDAHLLNDVNKHYHSLAAKNQDDMLAVFAKEEGQKLHRDLPERERRNTIEQTISKIETEIDVEVGRKKQLECDLARTPLTPKSSAVEINLKKCKDRLNALTMLSMSYQAGMTDADTPEEQE